jgi:RNA methyltransferase, TrmH family
VVREAVECGVRLEVLVLGPGVRFRAPAGRTVILGDRAIASASQTVTPQGVLAIAHREPATVASAIRASRSAAWPLIVLDGVQDPGNVGGICRSAAAAGAPALIALDGCADPFGPKAVRASAGTVFRLTVARGTWPDLAGLGGYAAASAGGATPDRAELDRAELVALGSEARGVRRQDLTPVTIPMAPGVDSLNVAAAAAILLFETRRRKAQAAPPAEEEP